MDNTAAAEIMEAIAASASQLAGVLRGTTIDPSARLADGLAHDMPTGLAVLSGAAGLEAMVAAVKVHAAGGYDGGEPAVLDGYGPVPPGVSRALVANGAQSFHRVLTDPRDGTPLEIGRESYRIPKALRQWLRLRDGKCKFPGCSNPSLDNEADHLNAWAHGGTTGISNLTSSARSITGSNRPHPGDPPQRPRTNRPAGSHPPAGTTTTNNPTGSHPAGPTS